MSENKSEKKDGLAEAMQTLAQADAVLARIFVNGDGVTLMAQARLLLAKANEDIKGAKT